MLEMLPSSLSSSPKQNPSFVLHQRSKAQNKMRKGSTGGFQCRLRRIVLFGFLFLFLSWILCIRMITDDDQSPIQMDPRHYIIPREKFEEPIAAIIEETIISDEEKARVEKIRSKALHAAKKETLRMNRKNRKEWEDLEKVKEMQHNLMEEPAEEEDEEEEIVYYDDNVTEDAVVLGMASNADLVQIKRFVGSLRYHGFGGIVILGIGADTDAEKLEYLIRQNVTVKIIGTEECTFESARKGQLCDSPYPHIKREWSPFPLARDWLAECERCKGPVLFTTVHNVFFQRNPFGEGTPVVKRLRLFQEHWDVKYGQQSPTAYLLQACKGLDQRTNMNGYLTSEIAIGHRDEMNEYLSTVYYQMKAWMLKDECHFKHATWDTGQAIVNFMRLSDRLPYHTRFKAHRKGVVNIVGYEGKLAYEAHLHFWRFKGLSEEEANLVPYEGAEGNNWIDSDYKLTDKDGYFIDIFFTRSSIIHEYNKFGQPYLTWLDNTIGKTFSNYTFDPLNIYNKRELPAGEKPLDKDLVKAHGRTTQYTPEQLLSLNISGMEETMRLDNSTLQIAEDLSKISRIEAGGNEDGVTVEDDSGNRKSRGEAGGGDPALTNLTEVLGTSAGDIRAKNIDPKADKQIREEKRYYADPADLKADIDNSLGEDLMMKNTVLRGSKAHTVVIEKFGHQKGNEITLHDDRAGVAKDTEDDDKQNERRNEGIELSNRKGGNNDMVQKKIVEGRKRNRMKNIEKRQELLRGHKSHKVVIDKLGHQTENEMALDDGRVGKDD